MNTAYDNAKKKGYSALRIGQIYTSLTPEMAGHLILNGKRETHFATHTRFKMKRIANMRKRYGFSIMVIRWEMRKG